MCVAGQLDMWTRVCVNIKATVWTAASVSDQAEKIDSSTRNFCDLLPLLRNFPAKCKNKQKETAAGRKRERERESQHNELPFAKYS